MNMKKCRVCKTEKESIQFHKRADTRDGLHSICKSCKYEYDLPRKNRKSKDRGLVRIANKRWKRSNREKIIAHKRVARAVASGRLDKTPCAVCGNTSVHGHHDDYSKPLSVDWLCPLHHVQRHKHPA